MSVPVTKEVVAQYVGERTIELVAETGREPKPDEVVIEVAYTGICGTDLHILHGAMDERVGARAVLGHEMSGRIRAVGSQVGEHAVGDLVTVMPTRWCGTCPACRAGCSHVCHDLDFVGIDSPGAMRTTWTVPQNLLIPIPHEMSLQNAALVEPTAVAVHDVNRAGVVTGDHVAVVGAGPVGMLIALIAASRGARVTVFETSQPRREFAARYGLDVADPLAQDPQCLMLERTGGAGADIAFEVSGAHAGIATAVDVLKVRGRCVVVGIHPQPKLVDLHRLFWRELELRGARLYRRHDFTAAIELISSGTIDVEPLITRVLPLRQVAEALLMLESGEAMKVLVDCSAQT